MDVEISAKNPDGSAMNDGELAASLMDEVIGFRGIREPVKSMLERAYRDLVKYGSKAWTRRRVRAVYNKEANRIDYREIAEMRAVLAARKEHAEYKAETARIASMALIREASENSGMAAE